VRRPWRTRGLVAIAGLLLAAATAAPAFPVQETPAAGPRAAAEAPLPKVAIVGASASAGFGVVMPGPGGDGPGAVPLRLADLLRAIPDAPRAIFSDWSSPVFFRNPLGIGRASMDRAIAAEPVAIIAIDYLFWYAYGFGDERRRLERLEEGLRQLDRFEGPMLVGDLPDMAAAAGGLISAAQIPSPEALAALNGRIVAWAAERPRVRIFPLSTLNRHALARAGLTPRDGGEPDGEIDGALDKELLAAVESSDLGLGRTLQRDKLHPTFDGLVAIVWMALRTAEAMPGVGPVAAAVREDSPTDLRERIRRGVLRAWMEAREASEMESEADGGPDGAPVAEPEVELEPGERTGVG